MTKASIVIPTTCEISKQASLKRAIASVAAQEGVPVEIIVVVNGDRFDTGMLEALRADPRISVRYIEEGHVSKARLAGARTASGDYYGFLDDDDELLPGALMVRVTEMERDRSIDVLVTNGLIHCAGDTLHVPVAFAQDIRRSAEMSLLQHNWFASPASLFRRASVDPIALDIPHMYFEWTFLFFRLLAQAMQISYIDAVTYRKYEDNPHSVSKSPQYRLAQPAFLLDLMRLPLAPEIRRLVKRKFVVALNGSATLLLDNGNARAAAALHLRCLMSGGWRYIPFTRRIVAAMLMRRRTAATR